MKCPACAAILTAPVPRCPECKFALQKLDLKFGLVPRHSRYLSDRTGRIGEPDVKALRKALRLFGKKFPQILFAVLVTELPAGSRAHEFAFWMANRARFTTLEKTLSENMDMVLVLDLAASEAALTAGYGLEPHVSEANLQAALQAMTPRVRARDFAGAIHACIEALIVQLRDASALARKRQLENAEA